MPALSQGIFSWLLAIAPPPNSCGTVKGPLDWSWGLGRPCRGVPLDLFESGWRQKNLESQEQKTAEKEPWGDGKGGGRVCLECVWGSALRMLESSSEDSAPRAWRGVRKLGPIEVGAQNSNSEKQGESGRGSIKLCNVQHAKWGTDQAVTWYGCVAPGG